MRVRSAVVALFIALASYSAQSEIVDFAPHTTALVVIEPSRARELLGVNRGAALSGRQEEDLERLCGQDGARKGFPVSAAVSWLADVAARLFVDRLEKRLAAQIARYSAVYRAEASVEFYDSLNGEAHPRLRFTCIRIVRLSRPQDLDSEAALDVVIGVRMVPQGDAIELAPLRLYLADAAVPSSDGITSLAISLSADAIWREGGTGRRAQVFDVTVLRENLSSGAEDSRARYWAPFEAKRILRVPIVPFSSDIVSGAPFGYAHLTAQVAETAVPPAALSAAVDLLARNDSAIATILAEACEARLIGARRNIRSQ